MPRSQSYRKRCLIMGSVIAVTLILFCFNFSSLFSSSSAEDDKSTLQLLHVVFRHGPRTPADTYPNDPHVNQTFYPFGWGHITNAGKRELFGIGTWLRKRYGNFLGPYYHPDMLHAQSTGVSRTLMSLQTVLASFFPPKNTPMDWNPKYNWQPIPIFSQELNSDDFLLVRTKCPRYHEALEEVLLRPEVKKEIEPYLEMYKELAQHTGLEFKEPEDIQSLYLTLLAEQEFGLELPKWSKNYFPDKMQFLTDQSYIYNVYTTEMQKIKAGPFVRKMLQDMQQKRENKLKPNKRKLFIYCGHDSTVVNIMQALKIWERRLPRYSVMVLFELHKDKQTGEHYVEVYYRNDGKANVFPLTIPGCDFKCPLNNLLKLTQEVVPTEADKDICKAKGSSYVEPPLRGP